MRPGLRINGRFFSNHYDASKYALQLASQGQAITVLQNEKPALEDIIRGN